MGRYMLHQERRPLYYTLQKGRLMPPELAGIIVL
jgi:hypothetical protein